MIELRGLTKRYGTTTAVDNLSFTVGAGHITGFLGPNGAGKTTTMRLILGLDNPTGGSVTVNGESYRDKRAPMHEVGALIDPSAVHGGRSAYYHLLWQAQAGGIHKSRVDDVLDMVGLADVAGKKVGGFSLGMRQRLGIGSAMLGDPPVLLFDEPVNGLDPEGIQWIRSMMKRFAEEGRTVFVSSHLMSEMEQTADHVLVVGRGQLIADLPMSEFTQRSALTHVRVVSPDAARLTPHLEAMGGVVKNGTRGELSVTGLDAGAIGAAAFERGIRLSELSSQRASLEAAFMELTHDSVEYRANETSKAGSSTAEETVRELTAEGAS
ncbi:MAG: ATP-binding cassette domain-containing protein [Sphaerobacteraceae bacterium]|nr:MAG: ATP-binding cassette domain-containing protein [Sphaerobacteraceae bacterium]